MAKSPKTDMARVVADVRHDDYEAFKALAQKLDLSINQLTRRLIRKEITEAAEQATARLYLPPRGRAPRTFADLGEAEQMQAAQQAESEAAHG